MAPVRRAVLALLALAAGCGDPLVDGEYGGEPQLILHGQFQGPPPALAQNDPGVRGAIFWNPGGTAPFASFEQLIEQPATGRPFRIPGPMEWPVFEPPGPEHLALLIGLGMLLTWYWTADRFLFPVLPLLVRAFLVGLRLLAEHLRPVLLRSWVPASAMAWILLVIVLVLTAIQLWLSKRWVHYEQG